VVYDGVCAAYALGKGAVAHRGGAAGGAEYPGQAGAALPLGEWYGKTRRTGGDRGG
jgi:hypothetical protein